MVALPLLASSRTACCCTFRKRTGRAAVPKRLTDRERVLRSIPEADWQRTVIGQAQVRGYKVYATRQSGKTVTTADGEKRYVPIVLADSAGFPDLLCVHPGDGRLVAIENKRHGKKPRENQEQWLEWLSRVPGIECWVLEAGDDVDFDLVFK